MKLSPDVCLGIRNNRVDFVDDPDYDRDPVRITRIWMKLLPEVCVGPKTNPLHVGDGQVYDYYSRRRFVVSDSPSCYL